MPLIKSGSDTAFRTNVAEMIRAGHPRAQALAAAYRVARARHAAGGYVDDTGHYQDGGAPQFGAMSSSDLPGPFLSQPDVAQPTGGVVSGPDLPMPGSGAFPGLGGNPFGGMPGANPFAPPYGGGFGGLNPFSFYGGGQNGGFGHLQGGGPFGNLARMRGAQPQGWGQPPSPPQADMHPQQLPQAGMLDARAFSSNAGAAQPVATAPSPLAGGIDVNNPSGIAAVPPPAAPPAVGAPRADGGRARFALGGFGQGGGHPYGAHGKPSGLIHSAVPGRTDRIKMSVASHSYIIPADIVSGIGQGNTMAGGKIFKQMFQSGPYGIAAHGGPFGVPGPKMAHTPTHLTGRKAHFADGGAPEDDVPILSAGGEYVVDPDTVTRVGGGDIKAGHDRLDHMVKHLRRQFIRQLARLPGPKKG